MSILAFPLLNRQILLALVVNGVTAAHFSGLAAPAGADHATASSREWPLPGQGLVGLAVTSDGAVSQPPAPSASGLRLMRSQPAAVGINPSGITENVNVPAPVVDSQQALPVVAGLTETQQMEALGCEWTPWSAWSTCTVTCAGGTQLRTRARQGEDAGCGGTSTETQPCNVDGCPTDCVWGPWTNWTICSKSCGSGVTYRYRNVTAEATWGGKACTTDGTSSAMEEESCNEDDCNRDCEWTVWADWGNCSAECGGGVAERTRTVRVQAHAHGKECEGDPSEEEPCNLQGCTVHCEWHDWTEWTACTKTCGGGARSRGRTIKMRPEYGGGSCDGGPVENGNCSVHECPIDCEWGSWGDWASCSATCGASVRSKTRAIATQAQFNGTQCTGNTTVEDACSVPPCPVDCVWEDWADWGACSVTCGVGVQRRSRPRSEAQFNGTACIGNSVEQLPCTNTAKGCPSVAAAGVNPNTNLVPPPPPPQAVPSLFSSSITGDVELTVENPVAFVANTKASAAVRDLIAGMVSLSATDVEVRLTSRQESLLEIARTRSGIVDAWYSLTIPAGTTSVNGTATQIAQAINTMDLRDVTARLQAAMTSNEATGLVNVVKVTAAVSTGTRSDTTEPTFPHTAQSMARLGARLGAAAFTTVSAMLVLGIPM
mmetsp:Transcript_130765/g.279700  ORF Transcript_130765/g.279700 Transcript_130765/m.279700 type:complete len:658 (-) Transcript_130765:168-2141(-)